jgi:hypothetical protein
VRKRCELHVNAAFDDAQCVGNDHIGVTYRLAVAFPYGHGGRADRPGYAADDDLACRNGPGRLVLSA